MKRAAQAGRKAAGRSHATHAVPAAVDTRLSTKASVRTRLVLISALIVFASIAFQLVRLAASGSGDTAQRAIAPGDHHAVRPGRERRVDVIERELAHPRAVLAQERRHICGLARAGVGVGEKSDRAQRSDQGTPATGSGAAGCLPGSPAGQR